MLFEYALSVNRSDFSISSYRSPGLTHQIAELPLF